MTQMTLLEKVIAEFPELENSGAFFDGTINLVDRCDGEGAIIAKWNYSKPLPDSLAMYLR